MSDADAMSEHIQVEAARIPDRDRLLETLKAHGLDARAVDEVSIEVHYSGDGAEAGDEIYGQVEVVVMNLGAPFVPIKHEGVIYIRPPVS
ncbi:MAG: hypothetical protein ABR569_14380 [Gaiellaceae bacterium]